MPQLPPAASSWSCCLGWCCHGAGSIAAVHCARTTTLQLLDNRSEAFVKVLAVHGELARERHTFRRAAAAYGVAFRPSEEARTHRYLLILR